jgi:hypothetical protein
MFVSDESPHMSLQVMFRNKYHLTICAIENILPKAFLPAHAMRQLAFPHEYLPTGLHIAHYI